MWKPHKQIAKLIHADAKEIVSRAAPPRSNNLALKGVVEMYHEKGDHIITSSTEHRAVLDTAKTLETKRGVKVTYLPVDKFGMVNPEDVRHAITDKTILISIMFANNEIGTINPIKAIGKIAKEKGILFHCDATQGVNERFRSTSRTWASTSCPSAPTRFTDRRASAPCMSKKNPRVRIALKWMEGHERGMRFPAHFLCP